MGLKNNECIAKIADKQFVTPRVNMKVYGYVTGGEKDVRMSPGIRSVTTRCTYKLAAWGWIPRQARSSFGLEVSTTIFSVWPRDLQQTGRQQLLSPLFMNSHHRSGHFALLQGSGHFVLLYPGQRLRFWFDEYLVSFECGWQIFGFFSHSKEGLKESKIRFLFTWWNNWAV